MRETILSRFEASRKELLDLGLRNSLLNYKLFSSRGLHIIQERSSSLFDILVRQNKSMSFLGKVVKEGSHAELEFSETDKPGPEESYSDTRLQTGEAEAVLLKRLLNTYYAAKTSIEEQGVNILYISLGMLHWYESESSREERLAPLVLIPVSLERSSARERFRMKYTQEEIGENVSLQAKMKLEFNVAIHNIEEIEDFNITEYFGEIEQAIEKFPRWKVEQDAVELGFFSFGKFMIYNDLDNSKWPDGKSPVEHTLFRHLFEDGFRENLSSVPEDAFIDTQTTAHEMFQVVDADSSQILTMLAAGEGHNLVIQGPPGTGKSQTITNLIADAIGQGKKVLFVAEKMAALEVVKRRLDSIVLGEACLELHSHKANKKDMHQELMRTLELGRPSLQKLQQEVALLGSHTNELNAYCAAINTTIGKSGLTAHHIIGRLLQLADSTGNAVLPKFQVSNFSLWNIELMIRVEAFADRIQARLQITGTPEQLVFWGSKLTVLMPADQEKLVSSLQQCIDAFSDLEDTCERIAHSLGSTVPADRQQAGELVTMSLTASRQPDLHDINITSNQWLLCTADIRELLETGQRLTALHAKYTDILLPEAWDQQVLEIRQNLVLHGDKWYRFMIGAYNKSNQQLAVLCKTALPKETAAKLQYVDDILEAKRLTVLLKEHHPLARELFGRKWQNLKSDWPALVTAKEYLTDVHHQILDKQCPAEILSYLDRHEDPSLAKNYFSALTNSLLLHQRKTGQLLQFLSFDESVRFPGKSFAALPFTAQSLLVSDWLSRHAEIHQVIAWNTLVETALEEKLEFLPRLAETWEQAKDLLKPAIQKNWYEYLLEQALTTQPALRRFQRDSHEEVVRQFRRLDLLNLQYNRGRAAYKHWTGVPRAEAGGQVNILRKEFNKKARLKPIRKVMEEAGLAVQAIKPVFMMSPLSIANFLPPGSVEFDLVIFDEASQVRPVDALGAILRGKQLIVVGDTKQLPPTSFFDSLTSEMDDEENVTADMPSILGMCQSQGLIPKMLRWHYRSRHESLIAVSNHEFYENRLVIFPSPGSAHQMGLVYHYLKDTVYDRGRTRTNPLEAEIVADAVLEHARTNPGLSLGVVAFSTAQRQAIQDAVEIKRRNHPEAEVYFKSHPHEPFFVKNLENVQGDERDVIFISIGYGRSEEGYIAMSFGPLNNEGGERRLNVLITRAKLRCEVFTNIMADDIDLGRTKSYGIRTLKSFLHFAQHGKLYSKPETDMPAESPFEENVSDHLTRLGYTVRSQVGSKGFYIDLAIVDPHNPSRYIIGIECDGASYHSARSARDRDRLRQQVLENIGWNIHRIWSTDWFRDPEKELKRLVEAIEKATILLPEEQANEPVAANDIVQADVVRDQEEKILSVHQYEIAKLSTDIAQQEIHFYSPTQLSAWIEEVVKTESPVHFDEMAKRIAEANGVTKVGSRIKQALIQAVKYACDRKRIRTEGEFLWLYDMQKPVIRDRNNLPASSRKIKFISPEEMMLAIEDVVQHAVAISPDDAAVLVAKTFGFTRVNEELKKDISEVITKAVAENIIQQHERGLLRIRPVK